MSPKKKPQTKLAAFNKVVLIFNIIAVLALLLSYLAPSTNPRDFWIIAVLGFGVLILVGVNLLFIIYWLFFKKILALFSLLPVLLFLLNIQAFYGFNLGSTEIKKIPTGAIRIMQYNVREFKGIDKFQETPIQSEIATVVKNIRPDILTFDEYTLNYKTKDSITNLIKKSFGGGNNFFKAFVVKLNRDSTGNAIFSKYPIVNSGSIAGNRFLNVKAIFADVKYKNKIVRVYNIHLAAVTIKNQEKSKYLNSSVGVENSSFIQSKLTQAFIIRSFQVDQIKRFLDKSPYPYILTGDFNDTPNSFAVNELGDGLKNAFIEKGIGFQTTYYSKFPLQIDYIFVSQDFDVLSYQTVNEKISDHKPVIADVKFN